MTGHSDNPEVPSQIGAALVTDHSNDSDGSSQVIVAIDRTADLNNPSQGHEEVKITKGVNGFGFKFGMYKLSLWYVYRKLDSLCLPAAVVVSYQRAFNGH